MYFKISGSSMLLATSAGTIPFLYHMYILIASSASPSLIIGLSFVSSYSIGGLGFPWVK